MIRSFRAKVHDEVVAARARGESYQAIGERLGFSRQRAHQYTQSGLRHLPLMDAALYRRMRQHCVEQDLSVREFIAAVVAKALDPRRAR